MSGMIEREKYHFRQLGGKLEVLKETQALPELVPDASMSIESGKSERVEQEPPVIVLTSQELDRIKQVAFQKGYDEGLKTGIKQAVSAHEKAAVEQNMRLGDLVESLNVQLQGYKEQVNQSIALMLSEVTAVILGVSEQLSKVLIRGKERDILIEEIKKCLHLIVDEPTLRIGVHPDIVAVLKNMQHQGEGLKNVEEFMADGTLGTMDFRIEWVGGHLEYQSQKYKQAVHDLLKSYVKDEIIEGGVL